MARHLSLGCDRAERVVCSVRANDQSAWANRRGAGHLRHARGGGGARGDHLGRDDYAVDVGRLATGSGRSGGVQSGSLACSRCNEAYQRILPGFSPKVYCVRKLTHPIASRCARHRKKILLLEEWVEAEPANLVLQSHFAAEGSWPISQTGRFQLSSPQPSISERTTSELTDVVVLANTLYVG